MRWAGLLLAGTAGCSVAPPLPAPPPLRTPQVETAQSIYQRAERSFAAGDFETTMAQCERALGVDPDHVPAKTLLREVEFILGSDRITQLALAQTRLEKFEDWLDVGRQYLFRGNLAQAEFCALLADDLVVLLPPEMDVELRRAQVQALFDWVKALREDGEQ